MENPVKKDSSDILNQLKVAQEQIQSLQRRIEVYERVQPHDPPSAGEGDNTMERVRRDTLANKDIRRYSRQLILPEIGVKGQLALVNSSVLIVGAGGLGCPSAIYLAAAGVGHIGVVDYDDVELDNLHRQILHTEQKLGRSKSESVSTSIHSLNSSVICTPYNIQLSRQNALALIEQYDIILDCTDNVATRYLLNDACVIAKKPLVSASALRFEGQLTVYNHDGGPCYRCLFPQPPPPETVTNCSDGGVLGVVPGIMGSLQALEAIKIITGLKASYVQRLLLFDGLCGSFRTIKLRPRKRDCAVCGDDPTITELIDYESFCGAGPSDKCLTIRLLPADERITAPQLAERLKGDQPPLLLDVRPSVEFEICHLPHSINIPLKDIEKGIGENLTGALEKYRCTDKIRDHASVVVVCRRGNDSQLAVRCLKARNSLDTVSSVKDLIGGLTAWTNQVDPDFPQY